MKKIILLFALPLLGQFNPPIKIGNGAWKSGWPLPADAGVDVHIARGADGNFVTTLVPAVRISTYATGSMGENRAEVEIYTVRKDSHANGLVNVGVPKTPGFGGVGLQSHMLMSSGIQGKFASGFPLWLSCQQFSRWDSCSNEINVVNETGVTPAGKGEYIVPGLSNGLSIVAAGPRDVSSAFHIGTQLPATTKWQRGIDFQQGAIRDYAIVLPNNTPVVARNAANSDKVEIFRVDGLNNTAFKTGAGFSWSDSAGKVLLSLQSTGALKPAVRIENAESAFSSLGAPPNGSQVYCRDCDPASGGACSSGGARTGAMAMRINGTWKCY